MDINTSSKRSLEMIVLELQYLKHEYSLLRQTVCELEDLYSHYIHKMIDETKNPLRIPGKEKLYQLNIIR